MMQEQNSLEIILKDSVEQAKRKNIQEVILTIPPDIFLNRFGESFGTLQEYLITLCVKYKLEVDACNQFHNGVKVRFRRDGYYHNNNKTIEI